MLSRAITNLSFVISMCLFYSPCLCFWCPDQRSCSMVPEYWAWSWCASYNACLSWHCMLCWVAQGGGRYFHQLACWQQQPSFCFGVWFISVVIFIFLIYHFQLLLQHSTCALTVLFPCILYLHNYSIFMSYPHQCSKQYILLIQTPVLMNQHVCSI